MTMRILLALCLALAACSAETTENPVELGKVKWQRDHDAAFAQAKKIGKPVLVLFQEVPG